MNYDLRLADRLIKYWDLIREDNQIPEITHWNASSVDELWQQCLLLTLIKTTSGRNSEMTVTRMGDKLVPLYGHELVGRSFSSSQRQFQGASIVRKADELVANPQPLTDDGMFPTPRGKMIKYRSCLLPFGKGGVVTHIVAGLSWREF